MKIENSTEDLRFNNQWFDSLTSTNQYCELLNLDEVGEFTVIVARSQTAGIGQRGNHWSSEDGKNLTFSLILKPNFLPAADQFRITQAVSLAVVDTLVPLLPRWQGQIRIKWPNDIYVVDRKICGMLIENTLEGPWIRHSVIGIGLNVNQTVFPPGLPNPTSMALCTHRTFDLEEELPRLLSFFRVDALGMPSLWEAYTGELYRLGESHEWSLPEGSILKGTIKGVRQDGRLILETTEGERLFSFKEIGYVL